MSEITLKMSHMTGFENTNSNSNYYTASAIPLPSSSSSTASLPMAGLTGYSPMPYSVNNMNNNNNNINQNDFYKNQELYLRDVHTPYYSASLPHPPLPMSATHALSGAQQHHPMPGGSYHQYYDAFDETTDGRSALMNMNTDLNQPAPLSSSFRIDGNADQYGRLAAAEPYSHQSSDNEREDWYYPQPQQEHMINMMYMNNR